MFARILLTALFMAALIVSSAAAGPDSSKVSPEITVSDTVADKIVVTYFHGNRRCATCMKLESYSHEAITAGFEKELADGRIEWRTVNFDDEGNKHYTKDYGMFSQSVILSHVVDGEEVSWKNVDKIWKLVGNKDAFLPYVQRVTREFMAPPQDK